MGNTKYSDAQSFEEMAEQVEDKNIPAAEPEAKPVVETDETTE